MITQRQRIQSAIFAIASICSLSAAHADEGATAGPPPASVIVQTMEPQDVAVSYEYVGQVAGSREVEVRARVTGVIEKRLYKEGSMVKAGEPLFLIESQVYEVGLAQAEAEQASAKAQLKKANREVRRIRPLIKRNLVSDNQVDDADSELDLARAQLKLAQAKVKSARIDLEYTNVKAPISGVVGRALKMEGGLAQAGSDSLLATMAQLDPAYVNFGVGEQERLIRQRALISGSLVLPESGWAVSLDDSQGRPLNMNGQLDFEDYKVDQQSGNFAMRATVANPDRLLAPGQFVRVILNGATRPAAMVVPQRAVMDNPEGKFVYVATPNEQGGTVAMPRPVQVGDWVTIKGYNPKGWVIEGGLNKGDEVVIDGMARIFFPGMPIVASSAEDAKKAPVDAKK